MNKYFIEILKYRTLLTIPKFGALTVANRKTGKIVFNPNLTFDDNVLSDYIADKEGIDKVEAKNTIAKFVREIEAILDKGETYDIFEFGKFYKNDKGEIVFESTISSIEKEEAVKKEVVKDDKVVSKDDLPETKKENVYIPPVSESVDEGKNDVKETASSSLDDLKNKFKKTEKKVTKEVKDKVEGGASSSIDDIKNKYKKTEKKVVDEVKETKKEVVGAVYSSKDDIKNKFKKSNKKTEKPKKEKKVPRKLSGEKGEKKKRRLLPLILLLLLFIGIGVGGYFYQDKVKTLLGLNKTEHSNDGESNEMASADSENDGSDEDIADNETVIDEELGDENTVDEVAENNVESLNEEEADNTTEEVVEDVVNEETVEEVKPEPVVNSSVNGNYHIIGGAFGEESNATKFAEKTGGKVLGKFNGLYQVAIKSFDTRSDASSGLKQLSSEYPSAWILKYPK